MPKYKAIKTPISKSHEKYELSNTCANYAWKNSSTRPGYEIFLLATGYNKHTVLNILSQRPFWDNIEC